MQSCQSYDGELCENVCSTAHLMAVSYVAIYNHPPCVNYVENASAHPHSSFEEQVI
jgi:hypothetical protein